MEKELIILSVESSCDETSVAIIRGEKILSNIVLSQIDIHAKFGGVVPEVASRNHTKYILECFIKAIFEAGIKIEDLDYVAVTNGPGLVGSLLVGVSSALAFAWAHQLKVIGINHLLGHIFASTIASSIEYPAISLLVSGGHTDLIYLKDAFSYQVLGVTMDDAVGETYDKVARILNLGYPGGPIIDKLAALSSKPDAIKFPTPLSPKFHFSFSGLKSAVLRKYQEDIKNNIPIIKEDYAASFQDIVIKILVNKTKEALAEYHPKTLILAGGVSANRALRRAFTSEFTNLKLLIPEVSYCTDNAAMIAFCAKTMIEHHKVSKDLDYRLEIFSTNRFTDL
ncbi:MAG: tRNA (adenosine(37)-N6)-threonylcarbamoyltransferase complex transferase subunit TsaD [Acholeplasmatales bacterium]|jgi:N6-L-threonylcarbamoyladenine synthase|nr:tRNA (adenosine(37)-N6)-threonylcarbamoyltransferase complex transferase subunit TsaD [Acholeplasmatales bacterium]